MFTLYNYFILKKQIKRLENQINDAKKISNNENSFLYFEIMHDLLLLEKDYYKNKIFYEINIIIAAIVLIGLYFTYFK